MPLVGKRVARLLAEPVRSHYVFDQVTGEMVRKQDYVRTEPTAPVVHGNIKEFISPITREMIHDRKQLRNHNKQHGVTDSRDYSPEFMKKAEHARHDVMTGNTKQAKNERIEMLNEALRKQGI